MRAVLVPPVTLEAIRQALSLAADAFVDGGLIWDDYGEFSALANQEGGLRGTLGHLRGRTSQTFSLDTGVTRLELSANDIRDLPGDKIGGILQNLRQVDSRTRMAVSRWKAAKNEIRELQDRFIDLRIALESLFLPQQSDPELKFRLAASGAWLVGEDSADKRSVWNTLRDAYDLSSTAVHGGNLKKKVKNLKKYKSSSALLADAIEICRKGVLRALEEGPVTDRAGLILDCPDEISG